MNHTPIPTDGDLEELTSFSGAYCAYRPTYSFKVALEAGDWTPFTMATIAECVLAQKGQSIC